MTLPAFGGRILDDTAILDIAAGTTIYARAVTETALQAGLTLAVPSAALAAAWAAAAPAGRLFIDDLLDLPVVVVDPLDAPAARGAGAVITGFRAAVEHGHVVVSARARGWTVVTADPEPLRALAPDVEVEPLP